MTPQKPFHALPPIRHTVNIAGISRGHSVENVRLQRGSGSSNENPIDVEVLGNGLKYLFLDHPRISQIIGEIDPHSLRFQREVFEAGKLHFYAGVDRRNH